MLSETMFDQDAAAKDDLHSNTLARHFEEQAARTPNAVALYFRDKSLTYRELDERTNQLGRYLQSIGVRQETLVGVLMERSLEMVVALLAILKAGGAYVPLDPGYPSERIAFLLEDSQAPFILTTERLSTELPPVEGHILSVDGMASVIASHRSDPVDCPAQEENLMYMIYTSGSTGKPKGVMVEHRNVQSFFAAMDRLLGTKPGVWLAVTSISFDISVLEIFWTLTRGFQVVLHGEEGPHTIAREIVHYGVTHFQSTPSLARIVAVNPHSLAVLGKVKYLLLGGEALPVSLLNTLRTTVTGEIFNVYGPTETTIWSTAYRIPAAAEFEKTVSIGQPLANMQAYILDSDLKPVPDGEPGELYLGGEGVVRGYWGRPELTKERFVPAPFSTTERMYRTGDMARFLSSGNIEYLGRTDFQVKLRGFRIELGEIEATLEQNSAVQQAVVVAREDRPGDKRLVGYVVLYPGSMATAASLRAMLELKLPEYMVPSQIILLDRLPLTANGKIDRRALPAISIQNCEKPHSEEAHSGIEQTIQQAWAEVLGVDHVGLHQNFFDLGATSLMVPEVQIELQRKLGKEIPLIDLFQFHTVSSLAGRLSGELATPRTLDRAQRRLAARNNFVSL